MQTLVLDAGFQPVNLISGIEALVMVLSDKAEVLSEHAKKIRSVSLTFQLPKVIRLKRVVNAIKSMSQIAYSKYNVHVRDNFTCQYCDKKLTQKTSTIDHIVPKSRGGGNTWENTVTSCSKCNNKKDCRTPKEAGMKLLRTPGKPKIVSMIKRDLKDKADSMLQEVYKVL